MAEDIADCDAGSHISFDRPGRVELHNFVGFSPCGAVYEFMSSSVDKFMNFLEMTEYERTALAEEGALMSGPESVRYIVVHCTATRENQDYPVSQLELDHQKRGFRKIGYHFYVRKDGTVTQHRYLLEVGAHCKPNNRCSIGVCYEGGLNTAGEPADTRTSAQRAKLQDLILMLRKLFPGAIVMGHRDMPGARACDCPCFDATSEYSKLTD